MTKIFDEKYYVDAIIILWIIIQYMISNPIQIKKYFLLYYSSKYE